MKSATFAKYAVLGLITGLLVAGFAWLRWRPAGRPERISHVILISIDTCRADYLSCYGYSRRITPNIDAVAEHAVCFDLANAPVPITLPSHCTMLTGTIPPYHMVHGNNDYRLSDPANTTLAEILKPHGYTTGAIVGSAVLNAQFGLDQGFDTYDDLTRSGEDMRIARKVSDAACDWLEKHRQEDFFLFLHYFDPHIPYTPPEPFASEYSDNLYAGEIAYTDHALAAVFDKLKELGLYDSALLIITADHGEGLREHEELEHGFFIYQTTIRVPLIIKEPHRRRRRRIAAAVGLVDIVPTILTLLQIPVPQAIQGQDLSAYLRRTTPRKEDRDFYCESMEPKDYGCTPLFGVIGNEWKYIQCAHPELYNLSKDPNETKNLITGRQPLADTLKKRLLSMLKKHTRAGDESRFLMDDKTRKQLQSLGYVSGGSTAVRFEFTETGADPKELVQYHEWRQMASWLTYEGKYEQAKRFCMKMLASRPEVPYAHYLLGNIALDQNELDEARTHFASYLDRMQKMHRTAFHETWIKVDTWRAHFGLALAAVKQESIPQAIQHLSEVIRIHPEHAGAHKLLADLLAGQGNVDQAIERYTESLRLEPDQWEVHRALGALHAARGHLDEAAERYAQALQIKPGSAETHYGLANVFLRQGKSDRAIEHFHQALKINPDFPEAYNNLGSVLAGLGKTDEAVDSFKKAIALKKDYAQAHFNLAHVFAGRGEYLPAIEHFTIVLALKPDHTPARMQLASALTKTGKFDQAIAEYREVLRVNPGHEAAQRALEALMNQSSQPAQR